MFWLAVLFFVVPLAELAVIVQVAGWIGIPETIVGLIVISLVGGWLVKREGLGVWRRLQAQLERGHLPRTEAVDGFLVLLAGALLLTPGFLTDLLAALLLVPPSRAVLRRLVMRWWAHRQPLAHRVVFVGAGPTGDYRRPPDGNGDFIDVDSTEADRRAADARELDRP